MDGAYREAERKAKLGVPADLLDFALQQTRAQEDNTDTIERALRGGAKWETVLLNFPEYQKKWIDHYCQQVTNGASPHSSVFASVAEAIVTYDPQRAYALLEDKIKHNPRREQTIIKMAKALASVNLPEAIALLKRQQEQDKRAVINAIGMVLAPKETHEKDTKERDAGNAAKISFIRAVGPLEIEIVREMMRNEIAIYAQGVKTVEFASVLLRSGHRTEIEPLIEGFTPHDRDCTEMPIYTGLIRTLCGRDATDFFE